jgi:phosphoheptose isomerase
VVKRAWVSHIFKAISSVDESLLENVANMIKSSQLVLVAGNGGSASLASHLAQAIGKPSYQAGGGVSSICLTDNVSLLTAHANDGGWDSALESVAEPYMRIPCVLVLISSSGKSKNLVNLATKCKFAYKHPIVTLTGFDGTPLRDMATVSLHVNSYDYEIVEPAHDALIHRIQYYLRQA